MLLTIPIFITHLTRDDSKLLIQASVPLHISYSSPRKSEHNSPEDQTDNRREYWPFYVTMESPWQSPMRMANVASSRWSPRATKLHSKPSRWSLSPTVEVVVRKTGPTVKVVVRKTGPTARWHVGYIGSFLLLRSSTLAGSRH
jgi:hypothetical protein